MAAEGELGGAEAGGGDALHAGAEEVEIVDVAGGDGKGADGLFVEDFALGDVARDGDESGVGIDGDGVGGGADFEDDIDAGLLADGEANAGLFEFGEAGRGGAEFVFADAEEREAEVAVLVGDGGDFCVCIEIAGGDFCGGDGGAGLIADVAIEGGVGGVGLGEQGEGSE